MFKKLREEFNKADDEDKIIMVLVCLVGTFFVLALIAFIVLILTELAPYLIGAAVLYLVGVKVFGWPIPAAVKKLFKK